MREIKFRAWNKLGNKWDFCGFGLGDAVGYNGDYSASNAGFGCMELESIDVDMLNKDAYIIEQYTGLKDKDGNEIYEGDIIKGDGVSKVIFYDSSWCLQTKSWTFPFLDCAIDQCIVIGNIHENPELLNA